MTEYEVSVEEVTPCGGTQHARRSVREIETDCPEAWVKGNSPFPVLDIIDCENGDIKIITGSDAGYRTTFIFTK